jgi:hypothetical protein
VFAFEPHVANGVGEVIKPRRTEIGLGRA